MSYRRSYRPYQRDWSQWHNSQLDKQSALFGGVDEDVRAAFLGLPGPQLRMFLLHYKKKYGAAAHSYAEQVFPKWQAGDTRISAQTTQRLLELLPPFLGQGVKCDLIRKLREKHRATSTYTLAVTTANYRNIVYPAARELIERAYSANLPVAIEERLKWLGDSDSEAIRNLLANAEASAAALGFSRLDEEFLTIGRVLSGLKVKEANHRIELPYGILILNVKRGESMADPKSAAGIVTMNPRIGSPAVSTSDQLLKHAVQNLTPEQLNQISMSATEEALKLQAESMRADQRHTNAERDFERLIDNNRQLQADPNNSTSYTSVINTASGTTTIVVTKDKSKVWILVAIGLAVLVLLLIFKR